MPSNSWMTTPYPLTWVTDKAATRQASTARHIADKPVALVLNRNGTFLASQTVRIEGVASPHNAGQVSFDAQQTYMRSCTVFGLPTLNIAVGDRFGFEATVYSVTGVTTHAGEIQATGERYQT